jgi:uncharacterized protein YecE (DUF72 family)
MRQGDVRIGISGWTYAPWRGEFYPRGLPQKRELAFASEVFRSVEINGTFYGLQRPQAYARWAEDTPAGFLFAVKGPRFITHMKRLRDPKTPLANFFASGVLRLGGKLGPILWQLPPSLRFDEGLIDAFLSLLPRDAEAATALARQHDERLAGRSWLQAEGCPPLRHALEIRHESFVDPAFAALLRRHNVALVCADTVEWPLLMDVTADFVYCRLHGSQELYRSGYGAQELDRWAARIACWASGKPMTDGRFADPDHRPKAKRRDVFVYFDNTDKLKAPGDAQGLMRRLGQSPAEAVASASAAPSRSAA